MIKWLMKLLGLRKQVTVKEQIFIGSVLFLCDPSVSCCISNNKVEGQLWVMNCTIWDIRLKPVVLERFLKFYGAQYSENFDFMVCVIDGSTDHPVYYTPLSFLERLNIGVKSFMLNSATDKLASLDLSTRCSKWTAHWFKLLPQETYIYVAENIHVPARRYSILNYLQTFFGKSDKSDERTLEHSDIGIHVVSARQTTTRNELWYLSEILDSVGLRSTFSRFKEDNLTYEFTVELDTRSELIFGTVRVVSSQETISFMTTCTSKHFRQGIRIFDMPHCQLLSNRIELNTFTNKNHQQFEQQENTSYKESTEPQFQRNTSEPSVHQEVDDEALSGRVSPVKLETEESENGHADSQHCLPRNPNERFQLGFQAANTNGDNRSFETGSTSPSINSGSQHEQAGSSSTEGIHHSKVFVQKNHTYNINIGEISQHNLFSNGKDGEKSRKKSSGYDENTEILASATEPSNHELSDIRTSEPGLSSIPMPLRQMPDNTIMAETKKAFAFDSKNDTNSILSNYPYSRSFARTDSDNIARTNSSLNCQQKWTQLNPEQGYTMVNTSTSSDVSGFTAPSKYEHEPAQSQAVVSLETTVGNFNISKFETLQPRVKSFHYTPKTFSDDANKIHKSKTAEETRAYVEKQFSKKPVKENRTKPDSLIND